MTATHERERCVQHRHSIKCRPASAVHKSNKTKRHKSGPHRSQTTPPQLRAAPRLPPSTDELRRRILHGGSFSSSSSRLSRRPRMSPASKRTGEGGTVATWRRRSTSWENRSKATAESAAMLMDRAKTGVASSQTCPWASRTAGAMPPSGDSTPRPGRPPRRHEALAARQFDDSDRRQIAPLPR